MRLVMARIVWHYACAFPHQPHDDAQGTAPLGHRAIAQCRMAAGNACGLPQASRPHAW